MNNSILINFAFSNTKRRSIYANNIDKKKQDQELLELKKKYQERIKNQKDGK